MRAAILHDAWSPRDLAATNRSRTTSYMEIDVIYAGNDIYAEDDIYDAPCHLGAPSAQ